MSQHYLPMCPCMHDQHHLDALMEGRTTSGSDCPLTTIATLAKCTQLVTMVSIHYGPLADNLALQLKKGTCHMPRPEEVDM